MSSKLLDFFSAPEQSDACSMIFDSLYNGGACPGQTAYTYNDVTKKCEQFTFNGCYGNSNRFASMQECHDKHGKNKLRELIIRTTHDLSFFHNVYSLNAHFFIIALVEI